MSALVVGKPLISLEPVPASFAGTLRSLVTVAPASASPSFADSWLI